MSNRFALVYVFVLIAMTACGSDIDQKIPPSMTKGAVENLSLSIEEQTGKNVKGGRLIKAYGVVPFDIKREQIRPTLLAAIKVLKQNNPGVEWLWVGIVPDKSLIGTGRLAGRAEYREGDLNIHYGIPSDGQIEEWNARIGKSEKELFGDGTYINDSPRLYHPDRETFETAIKALRSYDRLTVEDRRAEGLDYASLYKAASKETGIPLKKIKTLTTFMNSYYSGTWGKETISLK